MTNHPNTTALNKLKTTLKRFFSLIAWNVPYTAKIETRPKITINKFIKNRHSFRHQKMNVVNNIPP